MKATRCWNDHHGIAHICYSGLCGSLEDYQSILTLLLDAGADANYVDYWSETALLRAVKSSSPTSLVRLLTEAGGDTNISISDEYDIILLAALRGGDSNFRYLANHFKTHDPASHWFQIAPNLGSSCFEDDMDRICRCLQARGHIETKNRHGWTPLQCAAFSGNVTMAKTLLAYGADIEAKEPIGNWTPLYIACSQRHEDMVKFLLESNAKVIEVAPHGLLFDQLDTPGRHGTTVWNGHPIHLAASRRHRRIVALLLDHGPDINARLNSLSYTGGPTALHIAVDCMDLDLAQDLVKRGASVKGVANEVWINQIVKFEGYEELWEELRKGIEGEGVEYTYDPIL